MEKDFVANFQRVRRVALVFELLFLVSAIGTLAGAFVLSRFTTPPTMALIGLAVLTGISIGSLPIMMVILKRSLRKWDAACCPFCRHTLWHNISVAAQTALSQRCPKCDHTLQWREGFAVLGRVQHATEAAQTPLPAMTRLDWTLLSKAQQGFLRKAYGSDLLRPHRDGIDNVLPVLDWSEVAKRCGLQPGQSDEIVNSLSAAGWVQVVEQERRQMVLVARQAVWEALEASWRPRLWWLQIAAAIVALVIGYLWRRF